jgi:hypothetical protein
MSWTNTLLLKELLSVNTQHHKTEIKTPRIHPDWTQNMQKQTYTNKQNVPSTHSLCMSMHVHLVYFREKDGKPLRRFCKRLSSRTIGPGWERERSSLPRNCSSLQYPTIFSLSYYLLKVWNKMQKFNDNKPHKLQ